MVGARLHSADATVNTLRPMVSVSLRPKRSAAEPAKSSRLPITTVYALTDHCSQDSWASRWSPIAGRATFTAVTSSPTMKRLIEQMSRTRRRWRRSDTCSFMIVMIIPLSHRRLEDPSRKVGWGHVAATQDRRHAPPGESLRLLQDSCDAERRGRLDDESRVLVNRPHARLERVLAHQHNVVEHGQQVVQHLGDRTAAGDAVGDRLDAVGLDDRSLAP